MIAKYWIYTNDGRRVGEFTVNVISMICGFMTEEQFVAFKFRQACKRQGLDPQQHNHCIAAA